MLPMSHGSSTTALALHTLAASALLMWECEGGKCHQVTALNCSNDTDCVPTIGPTQCVDNQCLCMEGFCWAPVDKGAEAMRCRARVGSCDILPCGHRGVECIQDQCLCHSGYHADSNGVCAFGWWPTDGWPTTTKATTTATTTTTEEPSSVTEANGDLQRLLLAWQQASQLATMPGSTFSAYALVLCSALAITAVAAAAALHRHHGVSSASVTSSSAFAVESASGEGIEESCYEPLASAPPCMGGEGDTCNT